LTGGLTGTSATFSTNTSPQLILGVNDNNAITKLSFNTGSVERWKIFSTSSISSITFESLAQASAARGYRFISSYNTDSHLGLVQDPRGNVGIKSDATGNDVHPNTLYVNGTLGVTGATTLSSTLAVTGATNISNTLSATTGTFTGLNVNNTNVNGEGILTLKSYNFNFANKIQFGDGAVIRREIIYPNSSSNMQFRSYPTGTAQGGYEFYVSNGSVESLAATIGTDKSLAVTGNITEAGNNVLTNLDTVSLSNRINAKGNGTVTNVSGSGAISVANPTTTPVISVADAAFGTAGIVTASGTQQFSGDKVFEGITQFNARAVFKDYTYVATRLAGLSSTDRFATVTIGSGLSLSSGTLSATNTGTVTNVTGTLPISVANGTTTPSITIANASTSASGVVTTGTQSFAGNKTFTGTLDVSSTGTFGGRVNTPWLERTYVNSTSSSFTVGVNTTWLDINTNVLTTLTLPNAATYPGKELHIRQTGSGSLQSASSNIIPFSSPPTGSPVTSILLASTHRAVTLVSDGTNWIIMQRSEN